MYRSQHKTQSSISGGGAGTFLVDGFPCLKIGMLHPTFHSLGSKELLLAKFSKVLLVTFILSLLVTGASWWRVTDVCFLVYEFSSLPGRSLALFQVEKLSGPGQECGFWMLILIVGFSVTDFKRNSFNKNNQILSKT